MKKVVLLLILASFGFSTMKAQDVKGIIKVNPLGLAFGIFNASYEMPLSEKGAFQIGANYFNYTAVGVSGFGGSLEYRFYFSKTNSAPEGLFLAPVLNLSSLSYQYTDTTTESLFSYGGGIKGGYQWVWDSGISLDLFAGYGYRSAEFEHYNFTGGVPMFGIDVGYAF